MNRTDLLWVLEAELEFLKLGGYGNTFRSSWRPTLLIRDSILCPNAHTTKFTPCTECKLLPLVPAEKRNAPSPCHHIPLNSSGDTIAQLYHAGTQEQLDQAYYQWLCATVARLESEAGMINALESSTSISFKNILFLTDLTETSQAAYAYALAFARHYKARLYPAHAIPPHIPTELEVTVTPDIMQQAEAKIREQLESLGKNAGTGYLAVLTHESLENAVPRWIRELGIDLIVMGTHGRRGLERFLLGSTAEIIFRTATCPVLTVGPQAPLHTRGPVEISKVLFATDLSRPSEHASTYAVSFARERLAQLTFLHVLPEGTRQHPDSARLRQFVLEELKSLAPGSSELWHEPGFAVEEGDAAEHIINRARMERADLIVLGLPQNKRFNTHFRTGVTYRGSQRSPMRRADGTRCGSHACRRA